MCIFFIHHGLGDLCSVLNFSKMLITNANCFKNLSFFVMKCFKNVMKVYCQILEVIFNSCHKKKHDFSFFNFQNKYICNP